MADPWGEQLGDDQSWLPTQPGLTLNSVPDEFRLAYRVPPTPSGIGSDARYPVAPPLGWNPPPLNPADRDAMIKTIAGEAGDQPALGQAAVAHTILNRVAAGGYGQGIQGVINAPTKPGSNYKQFSMWNLPPAKGGNPIGRNLKSDDPVYQRIGDLVDRVYSGQISDPTFGATHYFAQGTIPASRLPHDWDVIKNQNVNQIAGQTFVGGAEGPGRIFSRTPLTTVAFNSVPQ